MGTNTTPADGPKVAPPERAGHATGVEARAAEGRPRIARQAAFTYAAKMISVGALFGTNVIVSRVLGPSGRGAYALLLLVSALVLTIGTWGLAIAATKWLHGSRSDSQIVGSSLG